jgi:hypothetical protein
MLHQIAHTNYMDHPHHINTFIFINLKDSTLKTITNDGNEMETIEAELKINMYQKMPIIL